MDMAHGLCVATLGFATLTRFKTCVLQAASLLTFAAPIVNLQHVCGGFLGNARGGAVRPLLDDRWDIATFNAVAPRMLAKSLEPL